MLKDTSNQASKVLLDNVIEQMMKLTQLEHHQCKTILRQQLMPRHQSNAIKSIYTVVDHQEMDYISSLFY